MECNRMEGHGMECNGMEGHGMECNVRKCASQYEGRNKNKTANFNKFASFNKIAYYNKTDNINGLTVMLTRPFL
jgi:hypothetical protein